MEAVKRALSPIRRMYDWTIDKAGKPNAEKYLAGLAFAESSFFPIPPDVLLIAMGFSNRQKALRYATITTVFSVLGGIAGYAIGYFVFEAVGKPIVTFYHLEPLVDMVQIKYEENAFVTVFTAAFTPIPYKLITIAAGLFHISFAPFMIASVLGRGMRFFIVALVMQKIGPKAKPFIEKYFEWFTLAFTLILVGGFLAVKYL